MAVLSGGKAVDAYKEQNVGAAVNQLMDTVAIADFSGMEWLYSIVDSTDNKYQAAKLVASQKFSVNPEYSRHDINGDTIAFVITMLLDAGNIKVYFQNDEAHSIQVRFSRRSI